MYTLADYGAMLADKFRTEPYLEAFRRVITPESVVVELGTGAGFFAILAAQCGAKKVYAIEPNDCILLGSALAKANGVGDKIEFIQDFSTNVTLAEKADVIFSDMRGTLPLLSANIPSVIDARNRLLAENGVMMPIRDVIWGALVGSEEIYNKGLELWNKPPYGLNLEAARNHEVNNWWYFELEKEHLISKKEHWATLNYLTITEPNVANTMNWLVEKDKIAYGVVLWFDATILEGIGYSHGPGSPKAVYGRGFFPFQQPVDLKVGDTISVAVDAKIVGDDYIWSWETKVLEQGRANSIKAHYQQSTFKHEIISFAKLKKTADKFVPKLKSTSDIERQILIWMDGIRSVAEIGQLLATQYPEEFPRSQEALAKVGEISAKYSVSTAR